MENRYLPILHKTILLCDLSVSSESCERVVQNSFWPKRWKLRTRSNDATGYQENDSKD